LFARHGLPSFDYLRPTDRESAARLLQEHGAAARPLMGGTDLLPQMRDGLLRPQVLVDVKHLPGMRNIGFELGKGLVLGAAVTMNELARHEAVRAHYPLLAEAANTVASYPLRNRATLGGNLCNASPCADTAPAMLVLEAQLVLFGAGGERVMPASEFFLGPGQTALQPGEFLVSICFPPPPSAAGARYLKLGRCKAGDLSLVGVAVLGFAEGGATGYRFRIGLGSVAPVPLRAGAAEAILGARPPGEETFLAAAEKAAEAASPITDVRGGAAYQEAMVKTLTLRALGDVWSQLGSR
jgi:CO/xanthine dehydrogenase FAD-binding subunit